MPLALPEPHRAERARLTERIRAEAVPIVAPTLVQAEVEANKDRARGNAEPARRFADRLRALSGLILVALRWEPPDADRQVRLQSSPLSQ